MVGQMVIVMVGQMVTVMVGQMVIVMVGQMVIVMVGQMVILIKNAPSRQGHKVPPEHNIMMESWPDMVRSAGKCGAQETVVYATCNNCHDLKKSSKNFYFSLIFCT